MTTSMVADLVKAAGNYDPDAIVERSDLAGYESARTAVADKMTTLVKGVGYCNTDKPTSFGEGGNAPLTDPGQVFTRAMRAEKAFTGAIRTGITDPGAVFKSLSPQFSGQFGAFLAASPQAAMMSQMVASLQEQVSAAVGKSITLTSPLATGFVPFNLVAPSRLIYPVN
jgi:hypothetical protein